jgi:hypothetical protein
MTDISFSFLQVAKSDTESENATESESEEFWKLVSSAAQITEVYVDMCLEKNSTRTSILSGMGWVARDIENSG